jgi:hypothetical protein
MVLTSRQFSKLVVDKSFRQKFPEFGLQYQGYDQEADLRRRSRRCAKCGAGKTQFRQVVLLLQNHPALATRLKTHLGADELKILDRSAGRAKVKVIA